MLAFEWKVEGIYNRKVEESFKEVANQEQVRDKEEGLIVGELSKRTLVEANGRRGSNGGKEGS